MLQNFILAVIFGFIFISCNGNSSDPVTPDPTPAGTYKVSGKLTLNGLPVSGALVQIGEVFNWKATTDADGKFIIENVALGEYYFKAEKKYDDNRIIFKKSKIALQTELTDIGEIQLPNPISLCSIDTSNILQNSVKITWTKSTDPDFVSYNLYRKNDPGLDESTGELVYVSTNNNDTSYVDNDFRSGISLYYRVYALTSSDRYSGSNLMSVNIPEVNLIVNGNFESTNDGTTPNYWLQNIVGTPTFNYFAISPIAKHEGNNGLLINYIDSGANPPAGEAGWGGLIQTISTGNLLPGKVYSLSFWSKTITGSIQIRLFKNGLIDYPVVTYIVPNGQDWELHSFNFTYSPDISYYEIWINTKQSLANMGLVTAFVDDIKIVK